MKVIITGSEGLIGRALSQALQKRGVEVIGIDRKSGREVADIANYIPDDLDAVFHLAAQTSVFNNDLIQIRKDNIDSFMAVVDACAGHPNHPKLVYASRKPTICRQQEFDNFRKSIEQKFITADTFNVYKKSLETRLKSIEGKLTHRYALLTINRHDKNGYSESKSYFNLDSIIRAFKNGSLQWLKSIIACLSIGLLALHLISSITN